MVEGRIGRGGDGSNCTALLFIQQTDADAGSLCKLLLSRLEELRGHVYSGVALRS